MLIEGNLGEIRTYIKNYFKRKIENAGKRIDRGLEKNLQKRGNNE